jgi:1-acyl-sn-glycerol-3-phosphate acyltransferase
LVQIFFYCLPTKAKVWFPVYYHKAVCFLLNINVQIKGEPLLKKNTIYISNHWSWVDIPVLGSVKPLSFVAKAEVATWPIFGLMAKLQNTVFVKREKKLETKKQRDEIAKRLSKGHCLVLFPEGTSNDGNRILPFKSALFAAAEIANSASSDTLWIQPIVIVYTHKNGLPLNREERPFIAWYGDMNMLSHIKDMLHLGRIDCIIYVHKPVQMKQFEHRRYLAQYTENLIRKTLADIQTGREHKN